MRRLTGRPAWDGRDGRSQASAGRQEPELSPGEVGAGRRGPETGIVREGRQEPEPGVGGAGQFRLGANRR